MSTPSKITQPLSGAKSAFPAPPQGDLAELADVTPLSWVLLAGALLAVAWAYVETFRQLIHVWDVDPSYSHGFVVPFFAIGLATVAYQRHLVSPLKLNASRRDLIVGVAEIAVGVNLHLASVFLGKFGLLLDVIALIFILLGLLMVAGGKASNQAYSFPVFFLIFMAPLPLVIYTPIALVLQNLASTVTVFLFDLCGIAAQRQGFHIRIPGHQMEVGDACSGLRSLTAILALAAAVAYLSGRSMTYRWTLGMIAAPVAIAVNCLRVFGTGLIMLYIGPEWASGDAHKYEGMLMIGIAALIILFLAWLFAAMEDWLRGEGRNAAQ
ncbi:MAG: exosortase/archaeosortase family protein, partial [Planctomycetales bacterium]|nr:exosortase/archaeosortase family protein [Planctomycetales bacterium]